MTNGLDQPRQPFTSTSQSSNRNSRVANPLIKNANDTVQRFLLMGSQWSNNTPSAASASPNKNSGLRLFLSSNRDRERSPAKQPSSVVAMAGSVLTIPSGSQY